MLTFCGEPIRFDTHKSKPLWRLLEIRSALRTVFSGPEFLIPGFVEIEKELERRARVAERLGIHCELTKRYAGC